MEIYAAPKRSMPKITRQFFDRAASAFAFLAATLLASLLAYTCESRAQAAENWECLHESAASISDRH